MAKPLWRKTKFGSQRRKQRTRELPSLSSPLSARPARAQTGGRIPRVGSEARTEVLGPRETVVYLVANSWTWSGGMASDRVVASLETSSSASSVPP